MVIILFNLGKTQQIQTTNKIADSFPGMDGYVQAPVPQQTAPTSVDLTTPPKWLKRPVGATFGVSKLCLTLIIRNCFINLVIFDQNNV